MPSICDLCCLQEGRKHALYLDNLPVTSPFYNPTIFPRLPVKTNWPRLAPFHSQLFPAASILLSPATAHRHCRPATVVIFGMRLPHEMEEKTSSGRILGWEDHTDFTMRWFHDEVEQTDCQ
jgi:hypothetical protein